MSQQVCYVNQGIATRVSSEGDRIDMTGRRPSLNSLPSGFTTWFWVQNMNYWLHMPLSFVQSITSAKSWEKLPILLLVSEVGEEEEESSFTPSPLSGRGTQQSCRHMLCLITLAGSPCWPCCALCPMQRQQCLLQRLPCCPVFPVPQCCNTELRLPSTCLFIIQSSFYYPAFSYLCPLLKVDLFILESLSFLCPRVHLLVSLFHLFPAWHEVFVKAFLTPLNPFG